MEERYKVVTERRTSSSTTYLEFDPPTPKPLPVAPLVSFDLHFDNLKDFLNNVSEVVNQHTSVLRALISEVKNRTTVTETYDILKEISDALPKPPGEPKSDDIRGRSRSASISLKEMVHKVDDLVDFKAEIYEKLKRMQAEIEERPIRSEVERTISTSRKQIESAVNSRFSETELMIQQTEKKLSDKIDELGKQFRDLEINTVWKLKDCEELLKARVNEKFVWDAVNSIEEKIRRSLSSYSEGTLNKIDKELKDLKRDVEHMRTDTSSKFKETGQAIESVNDSLFSKLDKSSLDSLWAELEKMKKDLTSSDLNQQLLTLRQKYKQLKKELNALKSKKSSDVDVDILAESFEEMMKKVQDIQSVMPNKVDKEVLDAYFKNRSEPASPNKDLNEFWKFRERVMDYMKNTDKKIDKLSKSIDIRSVLKQIQAKAEQTEVQTEFTQQNVKINDIENGLGLANKAIDSLLVRSMQAQFRKIMKLLGDSNQKSGLALVSRKAWQPLNCLSCGRGDSNFPPAMPHVQGKDGKFYRADNVVMTSSGGFEEPYEYGNEVFGLDSHQHAHLPKLQEEEAVPQSKGKIYTVYDSKLSPGPRKLRPLSARK